MSSVSRTDLLGKTGIGYVYHFNNVVELIGRKLLLKADRFLYGSSTQMIMQININIYNNIPLMPVNVNLILENQTYVLQEAMKISAYSSVGHWELYLSGAYASNWGKMRSGTRAHRVSIEASFWMGERPEMLAKYTVYMTFSQALLYFCIKFRVCLCLKRPYQYPRKKVSRN